MPLGKSLAVTSEDHPAVGVQPNLFSAFIASSGAASVKAAPLDMYYRVYAAFKVLAV
jgi:hypothetical protein